jgi:hypothetical protein
MLTGMVVSLLALGLFAACAPAFGASHASSDPSAQAAKKKCNKSKKRAAAAPKKSKCKKKPAAPAPATPPATGPGAPPPPPPPAQTTYEKIDAAVASGQITPEQGLTYKVFAAFGDPRLPGQYVGVPDSFADPPLDEVAAQWDQLSAGAKAILGPFLISPMHEGSYVNQQIGGTAGSSSSATASAAIAADDPPPDPTQPWCTGNTDIATENWHYVEPVAGPAAGKVRIWIQNRYASTDDALAAGLMAAMQNKIWPSLTTLMAREPLPDGGSTGSCAGGTDALDIALVDIYPAATLSHTLSHEGTPAQMMLPRALDNTPPYLAHEFMHAIQFSFNLASGDMGSAENKWLRESTAQWAMDYVSSSHYGIGLTPNDLEKAHGALSYFFSTPEKPLDTATPHVRPYSAYVFWLWATRKGNDTSLVRQAWNNAGTQKSLEAAKSLFGSGWDQAWKDFTRTNWNKDGITDYQGWDSISNSPSVADSGQLPNSFTPVINTVEPVAAKYLTFVPAAGVNELTFRNVGGLSDKAGVQAIFKYQDGTYGVEDWTNVAQKDVPMCDKEEVTLVLSNSSVTPNDSRVFSLSWSPVSAGAGASTLGAGTTRAANVCIPDPTGTFSGTAHYDDTATTVMDWSWSGNVEFQPNGQMGPWFPEYFGENWDAAIPESGSVTMSGSGTVTTDEGDCSISVPADSYEFGPSDGTMLIQPGPEPHYGIQLYLPSDAFPMGTVTCPGDDPYQTLLPVPGNLVFTEEPEQAATRGSYQGSATFSNVFFTQSMSWNLVDP